MSDLWSQYVHVCSLTLANGRSLNQSTEYKTHPHHHFKYSHSSLLTQDKWGWSSILPIWVFDPIFNYNWPWLLYLTLKTATLLSTMAISVPSTTSRVSTKDVPFGPNGGYVPSTTSRVLYEGYSLCNNVCWWSIPLLLLCGLLLLTTTAAREGLNIGNYCWLFQINLWV